MPQFLLEIFSEEIPARFQRQAAFDLKKILTEGFSAAGIPFESAESYATPRRLVLVVEGLPKVQPDVTEERKGPAVNAPEAALEGFCKQTGLSVKQLEKRASGKGEFYFAVIKKKGLPMAEVLAKAVADMLENFPWPQSMRWGSHTERWVRPVHAMVCLFNGKVLDVSFAGVKAGDTTYGHRFMAPHALRVKDFKDYQKKLLDSYVVLDFAKRREIILKNAEDMAKARHLAPIDNPALLDELAGLVEWPVVLMGKFDEAFLNVPEEVLISSMAHHQKYLSLRTKSGKLAPHFVVVANRETEDKGKTVVSGNERVLRARLSDARFFWEQDRKVRLVSRLSALKNRLFHAKLGMMSDKVDRIMALGVEISGALSFSNPTLVNRAAMLCKADLTTGMVGEFPELQGLMGSYYALHDGEDEVVAAAIAEHYAPQGPNDKTPAAPTSVIVSMADKLDTLAGFWSAGEKPTGSKDPYALRRAALGVIRLILDNQLKLDLRRWIGEAMKPYKGKEADAADLFAFFRDRLKVYLKDKGFAHDAVSAVLADTKTSDILSLYLRLLALSRFVGTEEGKNLLAGYRRAANILRIEEQKDKKTYQDSPDGSLFEQPEENLLYEALMNVGRKSRESIAAARFENAMEHLAQLRAPIDAFFDRVTVNCSNLNQRANRLKLLAEIVRVMNGVAIFSELEG